MAFGFEMSLGLLPRLLPALSQLIISAYVCLELLTLYTYMLSSMIMQLPFEGDSMNSNLNH